MFPFARGLALVPCLAATLLAQVEQRALPGSRVAIYNLVGRIRAQAGTGSDVTVQVTRGGLDATRLRIESGALDGRETLRVVYPGDRIVYPELGQSRTRLSVRRDGTFSGGGWNRDRDDVEIRRDGSGIEAHADLLVQVPRGKRVELFLGVGRVDVANVEGDLLVDVASAEVDVVGTRGILTLDTGSGRVSVRDVTGDVSVDAGSGRVSLDRVKGDVLTIDSGSGGVQASDIEVRELRAEVGSGGMRMHRMKTDIASVETGSGGAYLELLSEFQRLTVETGSGGATIRAPATLGAELRVETGSGGFQTDFQITTRRMSRNHVEGRIGSGKSRIDIEAGSGAVRLLKN